MQLPIESQYVQTVPDNLNAEVSPGPPATVQLLLCSLCTLAAAGGWMQTALLWCGMQAAATLTCCLYVPCPCRLCWARCRTSATPPAGWATRE